jgi:hypothetical protein
MRFFSSTPLNDKPIPCSSNPIATTRFACWESAQLDLQAYAAGLAATCSVRRPFDPAEPFARCGRGVRKTLIRGGSRARGPAAVPSDTRV